MVLRFMVNGYSVCLLSLQYYLVATMHTLTATSVSPVIVVGVVHRTFNHYFHIGRCARI
jgi:hypothetical protein